jgi:hypothetical protein
MTDERREPTESADEDALRQGRETADQERARIRKELPGSTGVEQAEDPELRIGLPGGGAERVRGYE